MVDQFHELELTIRPLCMRDVLKRSRKFLDRNILRRETVVCSAATENSVTSSLECWYTVICRATYSLIKRNETAPLKAQGEPRESAILLFRKLQNQLDLFMNEIPSLISLGNWTLIKNFFLQKINKKELLDLEGKVEKRKRNEEMNEFKTNWIREFQLSFE